MTSGKDVILTAIKKRGVDYVLDNIAQLADNALVTERYAKSIVRQVVTGKIAIKKVRV